jgi:hypothetical protein
MIDERDLLLTLYNEQRAQARWHEEQRERVSSLCVAVAGVLLALQGPAGADLVPVTSLMLVGIGVFGAVTAWKHYERNRLHAELARTYRRRLAALVGATEIEAMNAMAAQRHGVVWRATQHLRLYRLWTTMNLLVAMLGLAILLTGQGFGDARAEPAPPSSTLVV